MRIGSLFSGYEGLGMGVQAVLGGDIAWVSDIDPGACKILAHRYPDVPNLGDITTVDWTAVEPVDVLTGGFPCQDVSCAGLRKGMRPDTRSGLWTQMAYAIDQLRPSLVVIENVRGLLSAEAHSDLEPCPWCVGDGDAVVLRALGAVLGDLADIGYDASWQGLRAADVGAPHGRFRVFVVARPADSAGDPWRLGHGDDDAAGHAAMRGRDGTRSAGRRGEPARPARGSGLAAADAEGQGREGARPESSGGGPQRSRGAAPHTEGDGRHEGWTEPARLVGGSDAALSGDAPADAHGERLARAEQSAQGRRPAADNTGGLGVAAADADRDGLVGLKGAPTGRYALRADQRDDADGRGHAVAAYGQGDPGRFGDGDGVPAVEWGPFTQAVRRWERLTRPAPAPVEPGKTGQPRLSPAFVEWMQGLPAGWVTDIPGLSRNEQLKALGNGVVPQQAEAALRLLLADERSAVA